MAVVVVSHVSGPDLVTSPDQTLLIGTVPDSKRIISGRPRQGSITRLPC
jgi:hypothetical protein